MAMSVAAGGGSCADVGRGESPGEDSATVAGSRNEVLGVEEQKSVTYV
jgi:hypothetical protein